MTDTDGSPSSGQKISKSATAFRTISEVATELDLPQHVLRFWETKFTPIRPMKRGGGRRYYRPEDVRLLKKIRNLLYSDGYTIKGVQKLLRERGGKIADGGPQQTPVTPPGTPPGTPPAATGEEKSAGTGASLRAELESIAGELEDIRSKLLGAGA